MLTVAGNPRVLLFDIETTDLDADFGNMIAFGYRWLGEKKAHVLSLLDFAEVCKSCRRVDAVDDRPLVRAARTILSQADMWITWYGKLFDHRYLNTRGIDARFPPLPPIAHVDLYWTARSHLKLSSNRLASVQDFLRLKTKKTAVSKRMWRRAQAGHVPSIHYVVRHCAHDVNCLGEAYMILRPFVRQHPRLNQGTGCRVCGATQLIKQGVRVTVMKGPQIRLQCRTCGHWEQRTALKGEVA